MVSNINASNPINFQDGPGNTFYISHIMGSLLTGLNSFITGSAGSQGVLQSLLSNINSTTLSAQIKNQLKDAITPALSANPNPKVIFQAIGHIIQTLSTIDPNLALADYSNGSNQYYSNQLISKTTNPAADAVIFSLVLVHYAQSSFELSSAKSDAIDTDLYNINQSVDNPDKLSIYIQELSHDLMPVLSQSS